MDLQAVNFPALAIAADGYVAHAASGDDLAKWSLRGVRKYSKLEFVLFDSKDRAWRVDRIVPLERLSPLSRLLRLVYDPLIRVRIEVQPIEKEPMQAVLKTLVVAIDADDDILTQNTEPEVIKSSIQKADSFQSLVTILRDTGALD